MKKYIVKENGELKILKVRPENESTFLKKYKGRIVEESNSLQDLIMNFAKSKKGKDIKDVDG